MPAPLIASIHGFHRNKTPRDSYEEIERRGPWRTVALSRDELWAEIKAGRAWAGCELEGGKRSESTAVSSNSIVLDIDGDQTLEEFWSNPWVARHCLFTYTTTSHDSNGEHRFRAIFQVESHCGFDLHRAFYQTVVDKLGFTPKDATGEIIHSGWFGNTEAHLHLGEGIPLGWEITAQADELVRREKRERENQLRQTNVGLQALDAKRAAWLLRHHLRPSEDGEFHGYWSKIFTAAAATLSDEVKEAFLEWHHRGHHGKTQTGIERRFDKAKTRMTPGLATGAIFKIAKDQLGPRWAKRLPPELQYKESIATSLGLGGTKSLIRQSITESTDGTTGTSTTGTSATDLARPAGDGDANSTNANGQAVTSLIRNSAAAAAGDSAGNGPGSAGGGSGSGPANDAEPDFDDDDEIDTVGVILHAMYHLKIRDTLITAEGEVKLSKQHTALHLIRLESKLLGVRGFMRTPGRIDELLLDIFRIYHNLPKPSTDGLAPLLPSFAGGGRPTREHLIPDLMLRGLSYIMYAKQGIGKTVLSLLIARAALATPGHCHFLDCPGLNPENFGKTKVLYIPSDGGEDGIEDLKDYAAREGLDDQEWYTDCLHLMSSRTPGAAQWRADLKCLEILINAIDAAAAAGTPYGLLIIDSLKAIMPDNIYVGDQRSVDYVKLINSICGPRGVTVLYVHHQNKAKGDDGAQGAAALLEVVHGVFRLRADEEGQRYFCIEKTRLGKKGNREIAYNIRNGNLTYGDYGASRENEPDGVILELFKRHYENFAKRARHLPLSDKGRVYQGIPTGDIYLALSEYGLSHADLKNARTCSDRARDLCSTGFLKRLKNIRRGLALANNPVMVQDSDVIQQDLATEDEDSESGINGWD